MAHALTPASSLDTVSVPDPGDARTATSVGTPFQQVTNRTQWLQDHSFGGAALNAGLFQFDFTGARNDDIVNAAPGWNYSGGLWTQNDVATAPILWCDFRAPHLAVLESVHLYLVSLTGHSALPATMPTLEVQAIDPTAGNSVLTTSGAQTDASANLTAYQTNHTIDANGLNWTTSGIKRYRVKITGEAGANSSAQKLVLFGLAASWHPA